jgi:hypothetical protein
MTDAFGPLPQPPSSCPTKELPRFRNIRLGPRVTRQRFWITGLTFPIRCCSIRVDLRWVRHAGESGANRFRWPS